MRLKSVSKGLFSQTETHLDRTFYVSHWNAHLQDNCNYCCRSSNCKIIVGKHTGKCRLLMELPLTLMTEVQSLVILTETRLWWSLRWEDMSISRLNNMTAIVIFLLEIIYFFWFCLQQNTSSRSKTYRLKYVFISSHFWYCFGAYFLSLPEPEESI